MKWGAVLEFGPNGRLYRNFSEFKGLLTLNISLAVISGLIALTFVYFLFQFVKRPNQIKYLNRPLVSLAFGLMILSVALSCTNFVFYYQAGKIFPQPSLAQNILIGCAVAGFAFVFATMVLLWFKLPYFGVAVDQTTFWFLGENVAFDKVTKIIEDKKSNSLYINYSASQRVFKYYRIKLSSGSGQFLRQNLPGGMVIEDGDQSTYFRELTQTLPQQEK